MTEEAATGHYMIYKPTLGDRAARFLGYRFDLGDEPDGHEQLTGGWAKTETRLKFSMLGRLRLLFSGRLKIDLTHYAADPIHTMKSRVDLRIYAPWEKDNG